MTTLSFFPCKFLNLPRELAFAKDSSNAKKKIINTVTTLNGFVSFIFLIEVLEVNGPFVFIYYSLMRCQAVLGCAGYIEANCFLFDLSAAIYAHYNM